MLLLDKGVTSSALLLELVCCRVGHTDSYLKRFALQFMHIGKALIRMKPLRRGVKKRIFYDQADRKRLPTRAR